MKASEIAVLQETARNYTEIFVHKMVAERPLLSLVWPNTTFACAGKEACWRVRLPQVFGWARYPRSMLAGLPWENYSQEFEIGPEEMALDSRREEVAKWLEPTVKAVLQPMWRDLVSGKYGIARLFKGQVRRLGRLGIIEGSYGGIDYGMARSWRPIVVYYKAGDWEDLWKQVAWATRYCELQSRSRPNTAVVSPGVLKEMVGDDHKRFGLGALTREIELENVHFVDDDCVPDGTVYLFPKEQVGWFSLQERVVDFNCEVRLTTLRIACELMCYGQWVMRLPGAMAMLVPEG